MTGTALARWSPVRELEAMQNQMNQLFRSAFPGVEEGLTSTAWVPPCDIYETEETFEVTLESPGVKREDVRVSMENNQLTKRGERRLEHEDARERYHRAECSYGSFTRSFTVPSNVDGANVSAQYRDGLLVLTLPKKPESKPRQIEVK